MTTRHADKSWAMATATWIDSIGDWFNSSDWSTGFVPGPGDDAVIPSGEPRVTASTTVGSLSLTTNSSHLSLQGGLLGGNTPVTLNVLGPAPSTLIGDIYIGIGVLQFGSGYITAIGAGAVLDLNGNASGNARVAVNGVRHGEVDRDPAFDLLRVEIRGAGAFLDPAGARRGPRGEEHGGDQGGFSDRVVAGHGHIANFRGGEDFHGRGLYSGVKRKP